tara:strand:+ start:627 stop:1139 length:513 start_codon:yes stop_codon:yes gene_type:complete
MKLSIDTEIEEIAELRASIAIIEDAIKRREGGESDETQTTMDQPEEVPQETQEEPIPQQEEAPQEPAPQEVPEEPKEAAPEVDLSALATSDYGERVENRSMDTEAPKEVAPPQPTVDNKEVVKSIIQTLKDRSGGNPIQMQDILGMAKEKNIGEDETRNLVNELQSSSSV